MVAALYQAAVAVPCCGLWAGSLALCENKYCSRLSIGSYPNLIKENGRKSTPSLWRHKHPATRGLRPPERRARRSIRTRRLTKDNSEGRVIQLKKTLIELNFVNSTFSSLNLSIRVVRACPLIETRQTAPCRAIRGNSSDSRQGHLGPQHPPPFV